MSNVAKEDFLERWDFFCREVAKANDILDVIQMLLENSDINRNAYNPVFVLLIDSMTARVFLTLGHLFDSQNDSLRLTRVIVDPSDRDRAKKIEIEMEPFLATRHKKIAHLSSDSTEINYGSNFLLLDKRNSDKIREILQEVGEMLRRFGVSDNNGEVIAGGWGNINSSAQILIENLKEHEYLASNMTTQDRHIRLMEMRDKSDRNKKSD